eukprot:jgi/Astpho2/7599/Aster-x1445
MRRVQVRAQHLHLPACPQGFIKVQGLEFVDGCGDRFIPVGWNSWTYLHQAAQAVISQSQTGENTPVQQLFGFAQQAGLNTVRVWALAPGTGLQTAPGVYNEEVFQALDYILATASAHGIRYLNWVGITDEMSNGFLTDLEIQSLVHNHIAKLFSRRNTFTGLAWSDDPVIFAWDVFNEPSLGLRCPADQQLAPCEGSVTSFQNELAAFMKGLSSNQMVTTGQEGFFGDGSPLVVYNPRDYSSNPNQYGSEWAQFVGQDFVSQCSSADFDYCTAHLWNTNWQETNTSFSAAWVDAHNAAAAELGKPLLLEEFGVVTQASAATLDSNFATVFQKVEQSVTSGGALQGDLFW